MNLIELQHALRQLRLGGIATVLETRLHQAQTEAMAPIDLISCLVADELTRRGDRLLERRRKQAAFRDPQKTLDVLGGIVVSDQRHFDGLRALSRVVGPVLGPFECYLTMRGIKTFALRMERQCANACRVAGWLASHPRVERVYFTGDPAHPDAATIRRVFPANLYGAMVSFEIRGAGKEEIFRFMDGLKMIVRATSLGDVHTMMLYPAMSSHREISPKHRERMGIRDNLVRLSVGIEAAEDIVADLAQALV
jgi:cystathionine gamma-synthase/methionine-gamma-lyase